MKFIKAHNVGFMADKWIINENESVTFTRFLSDKNGNLVTLKVVRDPVNDEYAVLWMVRDPTTGKMIKDKKKSYHTNDMEDAINKMDIIYRNHKQSGGKEI